MIICVKSVMEIQLVDIRTQYVLVLQTFYMNSFR